VLFGKGLKRKVLFPSNIQDIEDQTDSSAYIQPPFTPTAHQMARATAIDVLKNKKAYSLPMFQAMAHDSHLKAEPMNLRRLKTANIDAM
jgi:hypothetical protein